MDLTLTENVYLITSNLDIPLGKTLTVQPDTVLLLSNHIFVHGKLEATGLPEHPIIFASQYDAEYGGSGVTAVNEKWYGVHIQTTGGFIGEYIRIKDAGRQYEAVRAYGAIDLDHSLIKDSYANGMTIDTQSRVSIRNTSIENSRGYGISISRAGGDVFILEGNRITGSTDYPVYVNLGGITSSAVIPGISTNNIYEDNKADMIFLSGQLETDIILSQNTYLTNTITIPAGKTLTIQPGVTLLYPGSSYYITISGRLVIQGSESNPVVMSSTYDPAYGGAGVTTSSRYWGGLRVQSAGVLEAYHLQLKYATTGIQVLGGLTLVNSEIHNTYNYGIYYNSTVLPTILSNSFVNDPYGIYNTTSDTIIDASYNYWNSLYGPSIYTQVYNPATNKWTSQWVGNGTRIYGKIAYTPYLGSEITIPLHFGQTEGTYAPTGNYSRQHTDLVINGSESILDFTRTYNSQDNRESGLLGKGWTFNYEAGITDYEGYDNIKLVKLPDGSQESYTVEEDGSFISNNTRNTLQRLENGTYILTTKDQKKYGFNSNGFLNWIESKEGNRLVISLSPSGIPQIITDYAGREYWLAYMDGLLSTITDPSGRTVRYVYEDGKLSEVIAPGDVTTCYKYNTEGYLTEIRDDNNNLIEAVTYLSTDKITRVGQVTDVYGSVMTYTYDDVESKTIITDSSGRTTTQWFDSTYNITNSIDAEGKATTVTYTTAGGVNKYGEISSVTDRNGNTISYEYDSRGNVTRKTNPDSSYRMFTYDEKNNVTSERDEAGKYTYYTYNEAGTCLLKKLQPLNGTDAYTGIEDESRFTITKYTYYTPGEAGITIWGLVKTVTDPEGNITAYTYDAYGNVATIKDPEGNITLYTNTILGLPIQITSPAGEVTTIIYNDNGDPLTVTKHGGEKTQYLYDNLGRKIQEITPNISAMITDPVGTEGYRYSYYPNGSLLSVTDPENNTTAYTYDLYGNILSETRPDGSIISYVYDVMNRVTGEYLKESGVTERVLKKSYAYAILTDRKTQKTETVYLNDTQTATTVYVYDYAERQVKQTNPDGGITTAVYNGNGTISSATDVLGKTSYYKYDGLNRLIQQWTPFENGRYTYASMTYDRNGNKITESTGVESVTQSGIPATLLTTAYEYDSNNRIITRTDAAGGVTEYGYDANGNMVRETVFLNGSSTKETVSEYNHLGKPISVTRHVQAGDIHGSAPGQNGDILLKTAYTYDPDGNVLTMTAPDGTLTAYEYDYLDRPVLQTVQGLDEYEQTVEIITAQTYDYAGNIISSTDANGSTTRNTYNAMGMITSRVDAEGGTTAYYYDNAGRLLATVLPENHMEGIPLEEMSRAVYTYDIVGRILLEQDIFYDEGTENWKMIYAKAYKYDLNGNRIKELDARGIESGTGSTLAERIDSGYGTTYTYNDAGLLLTTLTPVSKDRGLSYDIKNTYDAAGRKITETNAGGLVTTCYYDNMGRVTKITVQNGTTGTAKIVRQTAYDSQGNILTQIDGNGNTTAYTYNRLGLVKSRTTPGDVSIPSDTTVYQYDEMGRQVYQKDSQGKEIIITYNHNGQILTQTEQKEDGTQSITVSNAYDKNGNLRSATDANGATTGQEYDRLNRVTASTLTVGNMEQTTIYTYDRNGNQLTATDWLGNTYTNTYDALNRLVKEIDPYGIIIGEYEYNNNHAQVKARDALGNETTYAYDRNNRLTSTTDPEGGITSQTYDNAGNIAASTDGNSNITIYEYDMLNRLTGVTNAKSEITAYTYDLNGNLLTKKDGRGNTVTYTYNTANLLISETDAGGTAERYTYYSDGSVHTKTDRNGNVISYIYNIHRDVLSETVGSLVYTYTYDANGNVLTMTDMTGTTSRTYDELGRVLTKTVPVIGTVTYAYDIRQDAEEGSYREETTTPEGNITVKEYDRTGRLSKVIAEANTMTYTYYANVNRKSVTYGNGYKEEYAYDANSRIVTLLNRKADGSILDRYTYTYDGAGNQLTKHEFIEGAEKGTTEYTYDVLNRLLTVTEPEGRTTAYEYDKAGNRTRETVADTEPATGNTINTVNTYIYDSRNRLTDITAKTDNILTEVTFYTYDNNGNQLTTIINIYGDGTGIISTVTSLVNTYDGYNQLITSTTSDGTIVHNTYNAEGYRVGKEVTEEGRSPEQTLYLYEADKVILETDENGSRKARNIYGINLLMRATDTDTYSYLYNGHADVTALVTEDGIIAAAYYYDAFGNVLLSTGNVNNAIRYAGYQYDEETGLYYLNARMYDPVTARFLQEDTYKGDAKDPLSLNLYTYCANNPIIYHDPTGHSFVDFASKVVSGFKKAASGIKNTLTTVYNKKRKIDQAMEKAIRGIPEGMVEPFVLWTTYGSGVALKQMGVLDDESYKHYMDKSWKDIEAYGEGPNIYKLVTEPLAAIISTEYSRAAGIDHEIIGSLWNKFENDYKKNFSNNVASIIQPVMVMLDKERAKKFLFDPNATDAEMEEYASGMVGTGLLVLGSAKMISGIKISKTSVLTGINFSGDQLVASSRIGLAISWEGISVAGLTAGLAGSLGALRFNNNIEGTGSGVTKPNQVHHFASNKSSKYTSQFESIANKYKLDLDDTWNKELMPHQGRHPNAYHDWILDELQRIDNVAKGNKDVFMKLFEELKNTVKENPDMLRKRFWE